MWGDGETGRVSLATVDSGEQSQLRTYIPELINLWPDILCSRGETGGNFTPHRQVVRAGKIPRQLPETAGRRAFQPSDIDR